MTTPMRRVLAMRLNAAVFPPCLEVQTADGTLWLNGTVTAKLQLNGHGIDAWLEVAGPPTPSQTIWMHWELGSDPQIILEEGVYGKKKTDLDVGAIMPGALLVPEDTDTGRAK